MWAEDSQHLILEWFDVICDHPSHIYHSALPFSPSSSWLRDCYHLELSYEVKVIRGLRTRWGTCSCTVSFSHSPQALANWKDIIAVGLQFGDIITLDAITGIHTSFLLGHTERVRSLVFSLDGSFLVSGSDDRTINLWDIQTSGVIKTFHGHTSLVLSISVSPDHTMIASGSDDHTIRLWNIQTGECCHIIDRHHSSVSSVSFSPMNPKLLISASYDNTVCQWDTNGHEIGSIYQGDHIAFSSDGVYFVLWGERVATVRSSSSGLLVATLQAPSDYFQCCCFSPNGRFVAGGAGYTIYIWDITGLNTHPIKTLLEHTNNIISLIFSSSLLSSSADQSIKFWKTSAFSVDPDLDITYSGPISPPSASIHFVSLDTNNGVAISTDSAGVVRIWDLSTGFCKTSFYIPIQNFHLGDARFIHGRLTFVWSTYRKIHIWDSERGEKSVDAPTIPWFLRLMMSGDGSKVFCLYDESIQAWSISTGDTVGEVRLGGERSPSPHCR